MATKLAPPDIVQKAKHLAHWLGVWAPGLTSKELQKQAGITIANLDTLSELLGNLQADKPGSLKAARTFLNDHNVSAAKGMARLQSELEGSIERATSSRLHQKIEGIIEAAKAAENVVEHGIGKSAANFISRMGTKTYKAHQSLLPKGMPARVAFGAAEFFLGQTILQIGADRLVLAMNGTRQKQIQQASQDGTQTMTFIPEKLSVSERVINAVIAGVAMPAGVLGIGLGAKTFFLPHSR